MKITIIAQSQGHMKTAILKLNSRFDLGLNIRNVTNCLDAVQYKIDEDEVENLSNQDVGAICFFCIHTLFGIELKIS